MDIKAPICYFPPSRSRGALSYHPRCPQQRNNGNRSSCPTTLHQNQTKWIRWMWVYTV